MKYIRSLILYFILFIIPTTALAGAKEAATNGKTPDECEVKIFGILPSQGAPASPVKLYVDNLPPKARLYLKDKKIPYNYMEEGLISFEIPKLKAGSYPVYFTGKNDCRSNSSMIKVTGEKPSISSLIPAQIFYCTPAGDRVVLLKGDNFEEGTRIHFDGIVVGSSFKNRNEIEIKIPHAKSGLHNIIAINPGKISSLSQNFYIEGKPVIYDVSIGLRYEEHYELIIEGENFLWGATPILNGKKVEGEVTYKSCNMLVYDREYDSAILEELFMQVSNPDGEESNVFHLSIP